MTLKSILAKYQEQSFHKRDQGNRFERLMQRFLLTDPRYAIKFQKVWLWTEFPFRSDLQGSDTGIDIIAEDKEGKFWAIKYKLNGETATINKAAVDSFHSTSGRSLNDENDNTKRLC
ncbi:hypothetical protein GYB22_09455 [bacterium]|nr:hypothetical protein [bacterium]